MSLTQKALLTICQGGTVNTPVLQMLSLKKVSGSSTERYRLLISDGMYSNSCAMLATQLNNLVADNVLEEFCVIRVNKYQCNNIQGKKVIIILELDILKSGASVGQKIGDPIPINNDGTVNENERKVGVKQAHKSAGDDDGQPQAKKPFQQVTNRPSMLSNPAAGAGNHTVYPIASLTPYQNKWTIKARVTQKGDIRRWSNARGEGHLFSFDVVDESGEIRVTAFKEQCDKFQPMIEIGKVYYITGGTLKAANKQYSTLNNDYEMTLKDSSEISLCTDAAETSSIPTLSFNFAKIGSLDASLKDSVVDVIGVAKSVADCATITSSKTGKEYKKRDLVIVDKSLVEVGLTLWGTNAETFEAEGNPVVAVKGVKVSDYNGVSLSCINSTVVQVNPDLPQCHELRGWFDSEGNSASTTSLTQGRSEGGNGNIGANFKTFGEAKKENLGMNNDKGDYYSNLAWISMIAKDKALYQACGNQQESGKPCQKKVQDQGDGTYRCEKCNTAQPSFNWRMIMRASMADCTDNNWVNMFNEAGEQIMGCSAEELGTMFRDDQSAYDKAFQKVNFTRFHVKIQAKSDFYNDEQRVRNTIMSVAPLSSPSDYKEYCKKMILDLEAAGMPLPDGIKREKYF